MRVAGKSMWSANVEQAIWSRSDVEQAMERETGIEPAPSAWKAEVLPLNYSRDMRNRFVVEGGGFEPPKA